MSFSAINNVSVLFNNCNSTIVFLQQACHANPGADKKWAESSSYNSIRLFLKFSIHLQVIMYHFEHTCHVNYLGFLALIL